MSNVAPVCPISRSEPTSMLVRGGAATSRPGTLHDQINSIPRAHDLLSAIRALNIINNIITQITIGAPQVNNVFPLGKPSVILKGDDHKPDYYPLDWIEEQREYRPQKLVNPDDDTQYVTIRTLKTVTFYNSNTDYRLTYQTKMDF